MVTVTRYAEAVLPHGTTSVFIDNHEIANVFGVDGIRWMLEEAKGLPLKVFLAVPSCVPALPGFEDGGALLGPEEIRTVLEWPQAAALGEMMNMPGVLAAEEPVLAAIAATLERGKPVTGHWSLTGWRDHRLHAYAAAGVDSDHESVECEDALAKLRAGMWVQSGKAPPGATSPSWSKCSQTTASTRGTACSAPTTCSRRRSSTQAT